MHGCSIRQDRGRVNSIYAWITNDIYIYLTESGSQARPWKMAAVGTKTSKAQTRVRLLLCPYSVAQQDSRYRVKKFKRIPRLQQVFLYHVYWNGNLRGYLHESGLSFNPDRTHYVSAETIEDWIIFVHMNPDWVATHSGSSSFHFSFRIELSIRNEISIGNHVNLDWNFTLEWNSEWNRRSLWPK